MNIGVVIPCYNGGRFVVRLLKALKKQTMFNKIKKIVVVDNASKDNSLIIIKEFLEKHNTLKEKTIIIKNKENKGASGGYADGISFLLSRHGVKYIWLLDQDSVPQPNCLEKLIKRIYSVKNSVMVQPMKVEREKKIFDAGIFSGLLIPVKIVRVIGLPSRYLFLDLSDTEYVLRARSFGVHVILEPKAKILHSFGKLYTKFHVKVHHYPPIRYFYRGRNLILLKFSYPLKRIPLSQFLLLLINTSTKILIFEKNRLPCLKFWIKGLMTGLRRKTRKLFKLSIIQSCARIESIKIEDASL